MFSFPKSFFSLVFLILAVSWGGGLPSPVFAQDGSGVKETALPLPKNVEEFQFIKISLLNKAAEAVIETSSPFQVTDRDGRLLFQGKRIVATEVSPSAGGIQIGSLHFRETPLTIQSRGEGIKVGKSVYRHAVKIWRDDSKRLSVVNEVDLEDYLKGVLPWEANPKWSPEVLKAQAVASRTYVLFKAIENQKERFAVSKGVLSQVYGGKNLEDPATNKAIEATRGEVLIYDGKIFPAYFHSTCGGGTTHAEYLWDVKPHPALKGTSCSFCQSSKHYKWQTELTKSEIEQKLRKRKINVSGVQRLAATDKDTSGRARKFEIQHSGGKLKLHSNEFRIWMDPAKLKSTFIHSIEDRGDYFVLKGRGWGHGVGMCQYGAKGLSDLGYSYHEILDYYYPGSQIHKIQESSPPPVDGTAPAAATEDGDVEEEKNRWTSWTSWFTDLIDI